MMLRAKQGLTSSHDRPLSHHPASFPAVAVLREGATCLRPEEYRVDLGPDLPNHAAARFDADDRRLSAHPGDADRRRHLLRHPVHPSRTGTALPGTDAVSKGISRHRPGERDVDRPAVLSEHGEPGVRLAGGPGAP